MDNTGDQLNLVMIALGSIDFIPLTQTLARNLIIVGLEQSDLFKYKAL